MRAFSHERRALKRASTKFDVDMEGCREFVRACPVDMHVDHIIPLKGKNVCGLHVLANLQYLPAQQNLVKKNRVDLMTLDYVVCVLPGFRTYTHTCYDEDA